MIQEWRALPLTSIEPLAISPDMMTPLTGGADGLALLRIYDFIGEDGNAFARLDRQADQQRQMLPGAEADILAGIAAEQRDAKRRKVVVRHGNDWLNRSRMEQ